MRLELEQYPSGKHPSDKHLKAFAEGRLPDEQTQQVADHVEHCDQCVEKVDEYDVDPETLVLPSNRVTDRATPRSSATEDMTVDDRMELQDVIGTGGMGVVYRAWQPGMNRHVAVKQLHIPLPQEAPGSLPTAERFQREIRALGSVSHPHLARIYSSGISSEGRLFYSMELIDGANLASVFRSLVNQREQGSGECEWQTAVKWACTNGRVESETQSNETQSNDGLTGKQYVRTIVDIVRQIALAVQTLHEAGILHRDIKPSNIMVSRDGNHATLMDLGLAGLIDDPDNRLTRTGLLAGSLPYISPEQFRGDPPSKSGDIYNLGAILWELLSLRRLFQNTKDTSEAELIRRILHESPAPLREYSRDVSPNLEAIVMKCLEKRAADRYESVSQFVADLDRSQAGRPVTAVRRGTAKWIGRWLLRHRVAALRVVAVVIVQFIILVAMYLRNSPAQPLSDNASDSVVAAILTPPTEMAKVIDDNSLIAWWSAEGSGSMAADSSSSANHGALTGDTSRDQGVVGKAFRFDGDGDYISFGRSSKWNFLHDGSPFTISGFVAPTAANLDGGILTTIDETSTAELRHGLSLRLDGSRKLQFSIQGAGGKFPVGVHSETALPPDEWTSIAVTFDGQTARLFMNGQLAATGETVAPFVGSTAFDALSMGSIGTTSGPNGQPFSPFAGLIDEVQIYNRSLSAAEIRFLAGVTPLPKSRSLAVVRSTSFVGESAVRGTTAATTHSGQGMSAEFPSFPATHSAEQEDSFLAVASSDVSLHYDFGTPQATDQIRLWNYHGGIYGDEGNGCGVRDMRIYGSNHAAAFEDPRDDSWELFAAFTAARAPADGAVHPYGDEHSFDPSVYRFIRLQLDTNYGGTYLGLAEIQFREAMAQP